MEYIVPLTVSLPCAVNGISKCIIYCVGVVHAGVFHTALITLCAYKHMENIAMRYWIARYLNIGFKGKGKVSVYHIPKEHMRAAQLPLQGCEPGDG